MLLSWCPSTSWGLPDLAGAVLGFALVLITDLLWKQDALMTVGWSYIHTLYRRETLIICTSPTKMTYTWALINILLCRRTCPVPLYHWSLIQSVTTMPMGCIQDLSNVTPPTACHLLGLKGWGIHFLLLQDGLLVLPSDTHLRLSLGLDIWGRFWFQKRRPISTVSKLSFGFFTDCYVHS